VKRELLRSRGRLEIRAVFPEGSVRISQFGKLAAKL
jgi:hypothetical protein